MGAVAAADNWQRRSRPASHRYRYRFLPRSRATQTLAGPVMAAARPTKDRVVGCSTKPAPRRAASSPPRAPDLRRGGSGVGARLPALPTRWGSFRRWTASCSRPWPLVANQGPRRRLFYQADTAPAAGCPARSRPSLNWSDAGWAWLPAFPTRRAALRRRPPSAAPAVAAGSANHRLRCRSFHQAGTSPGRELPIPLRIPGLGRPARASCLDGPTIIQRTEHRQLQLPRNQRHTRSHGGRVRRMFTAFFVYPYGVKGFASTAAIAAALSFRK
jgi:hypothetical protein